MKHPYTIGLEYGWADDALNVEGHVLLTRLSEMFDLDAKKREELEMMYMESLPLISQGIGEGVTELKAYVQELEGWFSDQGEECARYLGRKALDVGMTKMGWNDVYSWMDSIGLGDSFAKGAWMEGEEPGDIEIPAFFDSVVSKLGL